ncbi:MAG: hypothetical protein J5640_04955 [Bacteroidales bacterium]|nr:hypothetical protein [Bacteroidales bacterium]
MIFPIPHDASPEEAAGLHPGVPFTDLREYIEHKIGSRIEDIVADSPERFHVIEEEAVRDLAVMSELTLTDRILRLLPGTPDNPECARLLKL